MSSTRIRCIRKRRSDDESSCSDSDDDALRIKRRRVLNKSNIGNVFCNKFLNFMDWIYKLPIGENDSARIMQNSIIHNVPVQLPDNEDDVIEIDDDDDPSIEEDFGSSDKPSRNSFPISILKEPLSSSTPCYKTTRGRTLNSLSQHTVNGCNNSKVYPAKYKKDNSNCQKVKPICAPLTNYYPEVEILYDTRETPDEESDDLEIVSEISNPKSSRRLTRQTVSSNGSKFDQSSREYNGTSKIVQSSKEYNGVTSGSIVSGKAASYERGRPLNKSFTAHEVIRLQEKAHYQLILDKMSGNYHSPYHPSVPKKDPKSTEIEIDLTENDKVMDGSNAKRENLEKPIGEFLQKYFKPIQFKSRSPPVVDITEKFNDKDDDVQIIETESPKLYADKLDTTQPKKPEEAVFSPKWIEEFKKTVTIETEHHLQIVTQQEEKLERYRKRRDEYFLKERILRGESISVDQTGKDEFPELTPDMDERIDWALGVGSQTEILSAFKDCTCTSVDLATLTGLNWLNDSVINFYLALIMERCKTHPQYPLVYCFNSYFYIALKGRGPKAVLRWTRKIEDKKNIFQFDIVFVPLHLGMHWALCVIDNRTKKIKYYDSMQGTDDQSLRIVQNYLVAEKQDKLGITMDPNEYSFEMVKDIPQQMNGSDCGMFTLKYAEYLSRGVPITFSQEHMQYFRRRMIFEILDKKLF